MSSDHEESQTETQRRIGSNRLLSDLAVASVSKREYAQTNKIKNSEERINENELADSLEINQRRIINQNNQANLYPSSRPKLSQPLTHPISQPLIDNQFILQQQQQQIQQQQQFIPFQGQPLIVLQSPTSHPIVNSSLQLNPSAQFIPFALQPTQLISQPNMFYQEQVQPLFYNTAYPLIQNSNFQNPNIYQDEFSNNSYQQQPFQFLENRNFNGLQSVNGIRYDAQPLQPPMAPPRTNKTISQQSNDSYDINSPDLDDAEINDENSQNRNNGANMEFKEDRNDSRAQEYWVKLQKAREVRDKNSGTKKKTGSSLPSMASNKALLKKPPLPDSGKTNFLEKNIDSIRNKENLTHRYPEKKYENVHGKNVSERLKNIQGPTKKAPKQLQPIENYDEEELHNYNANKKISIPISPGKLRDQDHINVDINLRLVDFLPNHSDNRSLDDFDAHNDPLARYIRKFESNISRSLPGSSGSLNKLKPLPPLSRHKVQKPFSHEGGRLQNEYDHETKVEEGYLAQLHKQNQKAPLKTYSLKDYRNYKKDTLLNVANHTGKLGFDFENDAYKQKLESHLKKNDYAERVKIRNQLLISEQKKNEENSTKSQPIQEPSKTQRAKEYVEKNVIRIKSAPKQSTNSFKKDSFSKSAPNERTQVSTSTKTLSYLSKRLDLSKQNKHENTAILKIRDPVTSKTRTIFLNDNQIEELGKRHLAEKELVDKTILNKKKNVTYSAPKTEKPRHPIDFKKAEFSVEDKIVDIGDKTNTPIVRKDFSSSSNDKNKTSNEEDEDFQKLLQRHNQERNLVDQYKTDLYSLETYQSNEHDKNNKNDNQILIRVE
ncbi:unnamed protein product [Brachionus calyciflorus]|uniref:Uncharacterized protein n=1 Tax=Brachionus calyciflorus TaxID=104777 RepID=A0A814BWJ0_9BILA|nr:unnamed protein product [Brachionus calyciflorus]